MPRQPQNDASDSLFDRPLPAASTPRRGLPHLALAFIALGLGGLGFAAATSDAQFAHGLEQALAATPAGGADPLRLGQQTAQASVPVAGSEAFWLDTPATAAPLQPATWRPRAITRGDRFQFGGGREQRILEVTDVRQVPMQADQPATDAKEVQPLLMITLRDVGSPQAPPLRMLVDAHSPIAGLVPLEGARQADL